MGKRFLILASASVLVFGLGGCGFENTDSSASAADAAQTSDGAGSKAAKADTKTTTAPKVDRTTLPWNAEMPAEFPLEDVPFPREGVFDYATLVEEGTWNVMISDIPNAEQEAWVAKMNAQFKNMDEESIYYMGKAPSGVFYSIHAIVFSKTESTVTIAYRIRIV